MYVQTIQPPSSQGRRKPESTSRATTPGPEHRCRGRSIAGWCASSRQEVPRPSLHSIPRIVSVCIFFVSSGCRTYRMLTSVLAGWHQVCRRKQSYHPLPRQGIFHLAKSERCELCRSGCSSTQAVSAYRRTRDCRCCKWPL